MSAPRLLDLFCCQGGASAGYVAAGFEVVGVDIDPQPHYPVARAREVMGMDWATRDGLREAIPPAYAEHVGRVLLTALTEQVAA